MLATHEPQFVVVQAAVGGHVRDERFLVEVVADEVGNPRVDDLVVGDACTWRVGDAHVAGLPRSHQPRHAQRRIGAEHLGIEVQVVDPSVDDVHAFEPADRAHVHALVVGDNEVGTLDELGTDPLGEEGMLEVRRVEDAGCEHDDLRLRHIVGRE